MVNGVKFDGYTNGSLVDAKGPGYAKFFDTNGNPLPWWSGSTALIDQAKRQIVAASSSNTPIIWYIAEKPAFVGMSKLFQQYGITGIQLVYSP